VKGNHNRRFHTPIYCSNVQHNGALSSLADFGASWQNQHFTPFHQLISERQETARIVVSNRFISQENGRD
jgi:hypothetical protein